jgi:hypothetical protein
MKHIHSSIGVEKASRDTGEKAPQQADLARLHQLLITHFSAEDLYTLCADLGEDYESLPGEGKKAKSRRLIDHLNRRGRITELVRMLQKLRPNVHWKEELYPPQDIPPEKPTIEFVNRAYELDLICKPGAPRFILVDGPIGYGKTHLLRKVRETYEENEREEWEAALIDLKSDPQTVSTDSRVAWPCIANAIIQQFDSSQDSMPTLAVRTNTVDSADLENHIVDVLVPFLAQQRANVLLLFDGIEELPSDTSAWLKRLTCDLDLGLREGKRLLRVVFAGRYVGDWGKGVPYALHTLSLSPFEQTTVRVMVEQVAQTADVQATSGYLDDLARLVLHISGGHPRGICDLLEVICAEGFILPKRRLKPILLKRQFGRNGQEGTLFEICIKPIIEELLHGVKSPLCEVLKEISCIRRFDQELLDTLMNQGVFSAPGYTSSWELIRALLKTHLISPPTAGDPMFSDQIVRRMLAVQMQIQDPTRWQQTNERALETFHNWALGSGPIDPQVRRSAILESLYHTLQLMPQGDPPSVVQDKLVERLNEYLGRIDNIRDVMQLRNALSQDKELDDLIEQRASSTAVRALLGSIDQYLSRV